jgi:hypothetical protein
MIPVPSPVEGVAIEHDASSNRWRLRAGEAYATLRPWTWGERRRLLTACTITGTLDRSTFIRGLFDLLLDVPVPHVEPTSLAVVCLYLLGVSENDQVLPLTRAEFLAATTLGWTPQQIDTQPADDIDRLIAQIQPKAEDAAHDGWTRIVITPDKADRLESMLLTIARLAGLIGQAADAAPPQVAAGNAVVAEPATAPPPREPQRAEAIELTFGGIARLKPREEPAAATKAGTLAEGPSEPAATATTRLSMPEPRIARVSSRLLARGNPSVCARTMAPQHVTTPDAPEPRAHAFSTADAPIRSRASDSQPTLRVAPQAALPADSAPSPARPMAVAATVSRVADPARVVHAPIASAPAVAHAPEPLDYFPTFRATVDWPEPSTAPDSGSEAWFRPDPRPAAPFQLSDLEEQMADVLDRAAREAGIDLP